MNIGSLEVHCGGMFAEKSTSLIREGKRHLLAGRKVIFVKPAVDDRYSTDEVVTHDGVKHKAIRFRIGEDGGLYAVGNGSEDFKRINNELLNADVICIDEVQFFPEEMLMLINSLIYLGKRIYVAGLDMDRFGKPFGIMPYLMAKAEKVTKHHAVCSFCGSDAWVTVGTEALGNEEQVNVGNEYKPACRTCADKHGGIR
ncbi:thymidine kinase [Priestia megaterium]|uniref:thymidine kinase n=1 Tax=Priestia megaterium TaxID=1404 RepID=UPI0023DC08FE|nr:thymidine kinase [Priestia megaterium]MDF2010242.1 thymidine kinase [Priestia megaterium]